MSVSHGCVSSFVSRCVVHRGLHSFPTRRSSDLSGAVAVRLSSKLLRNFTNWPGFKMAGVAVPTTSIFAPASGRTMNKAPRSEEHTSELQSLTNLVCRLLLEKKNKKKQT